MDKINMSELKNFERFLIVHLEMTKFGGSVTFNEPDFRIEMEFGLSLEIIYKIALLALLLPIYSRKHNSCISMQKKICNVSVGQHSVTFDHTNCTL